MAIPEWQLPRGVVPGVWDYAQSDCVADDYDEYHGSNPLFAFEEQVLREEFTPTAGQSPGLIADLGCGTGRALVPLVRAGHRGLAVDLSAKMLDVVREKATAENLTIECLEANLVELDAIATASVDHALCLFSTLGMVRGRDNRRQALGHMRRILRPGGRLVLHVHNFWFNLYDGASAKGTSTTGGPRWVAKNLVRPLTKSPLEIGDKFFPYRGVPNFFLHVFRPSELRTDLRTAGLQVRRWIPLDVQRRHALRLPWLVPSLRANGWIVVCERSQDD